MRTNNVIKEKRTNKMNNDMISMAGSGVASAIRTKRSISALDSLDGVGRRVEKFHKQQPMLLSEKRIANLVAKKIAIEHLVELNEKEARIKLLERKLRRSEATVNTATIASVSVPVKSIDDFAMSAAEQVKKMIDGSTVPDLMVALNCLRSISMVAKKIIAALDDTNTTPATAGGW